MCLKGDGWWSLLVVIEIRAAHHRELIVLTVVASSLTFYGSVYPVTPPRGIFTVQLKALHVPLETMDV